MSNNIDKNKLKYFCIFGGGSIRGLSYVGAYKALKELGVEIIGYAGSSVGSIAATLAALDYDVDEVKNVLMNFDFSLFKDINFSLKLELAISKGEVFTDKIRELISKKMNTDKPVCFKDFPKDLYIVTSNLSKGTSFIFSKETTPDFEVAQAIRISTGFPGLMNPYELNGDLFVDGDLAKAFPVFQLSPLLNPDNVRVLEFRLEGAKNSKHTKNPIVFFNNAFDFLSYRATENILGLYKDYDKYDFIVISTKDTLLFNFNISVKKREQIINLGYDTTMQYFKDVLPIKKDSLCKEYEKMLEMVILAKKEFMNKKNDKGKMHILKFFQKNYSKLKKLDKNFVDELNIIADLSQKNVLNFLFFKISNNKDILAKLDSLYENINAKIEELKNYNLKFQL